MARDAVLLVLVKIQEEAAAFRKEVREQLDGIDHILRKRHRDTAGMLVIMKSTVGIFEERVTALRRRSGQH